MKKPIDWNRFVPLGMDGRKMRNRLSALVGVGGGCSMAFFVRYAAARSELFQYLGKKSVLIPGAVIEPFGLLVRGIFRPMAVVAAGMPVVAALLYLYHYQGCRSIYTMKRLPDSRELWRRCLILPSVFLLCCALVTAGLLGVYYLVWRLGTPPACLPL